MFANTLTLTIAGVARTLTRVNQDNYGSEYQQRSAAERINLKVRHSLDTTGGVRYNRHNVFVEWRINATPTSMERVYTLTHTIRDLEGSDPAGLVDLNAGMSTLVNALAAGLSIGEN